MPRRNYSKKHVHIRKQLPQPEPGKVRYATKLQALKAIEQTQRHNPDVNLAVYQSPSDAGWYLTSK